MSSTLHILLNFCLRLNKNDLSINALRKNIYNPILK